MYTDDELANLRFEISRPLEAILRQVDPYHAEKGQLWDVYEALDTQLAAAADPRSASD